MIETRLPTFSEAFGFVPDRREIEAEVAAFKRKHAQVEEAFELLQKATDVLFGATEKVYEFADDDLYQDVYEDLIAERAELLKKTNKQETEELEGLFM